MQEACALIRAFANTVKFPEPYVGVFIVATIEAVTGDATELVGSVVGGYLGILDTLFPRLSLYALVGIRYLSIYCTRKIA